MYVLCRYAPSGFGVLFLRVSLWKWGRFIYIYIYFVFLFFLNNKVLTLINKTKQQKSYYVILLSKSHGAYLKKKEEILHDTRF